MRSRALLVIARRPLRVAILRLPLSRPFARSTNTTIVIGARLGRSRARQSAPSHAWTDLLADAQTCRVALSPLVFALFGPGMASSLRERRRDLTSSSDR